MYDNILQRQKEQPPCFCKMVLLYLLSRSLSDNIRCKTVHGHGVICTNNNKIQGSNSAFSGFFFVLVRVIATQTDYWCVCSCISFSSEQSSALSGVIIKFSANLYLSRLWMYRKPIIENAAAPSRFTHISFMVSRRPISR